MKRVLRTVVLGACVAAAVAFGGIHEGGTGGTGGADGDDHATRAQPGPPLADVFRAQFEGAPRQDNECGSAFAALGSATGASGGGSSGAPAMPFDRGAGSGQKCSNSRG